MDDILLNRPTDRRLLDNSNDVGPPGTEDDKMNEIMNTRKYSPRRSMSPRKKSGSPRRRRSPSLKRQRRRSRDRYVSPPVRRYNRRSPDRNRRSRSRDRNRFDRRGRRDRSTSNERYGGRLLNRSSSAKRQWSPTVKPPPAMIPPAPPQNLGLVAQPTRTTYNAPPPPIFNEGYNVYQNQYAIPPYNDFNAPPPPPQFPTTYAPPPAWNVPTGLTGIYVNQPPSAWTATNLPPVQPPPHMPQTESSEEQLKKDAAVAQEVQNQKEELKKQRNDYLKKAENMKKELKMLKDQMIDLAGSGDEPPSPTTKSYIDENQKLQNQIQKKISTIENVIDMLSGIIGEEKKPIKDLQPSIDVKKIGRNQQDSESSYTSSDDSSPDRLKTKLMQSMKNKRDIAPLNESNKKEKYGEQVNYIFYDPEMHWCHICNVFPKTAKDYLTHLHSKEHSNKIDTPLAPWHQDKSNDEFPVYPDGASKRTPIRGLQFFEPTVAWYCKLCKIWMGDLHCASAHLKSQTHWNNYNDFFQKNLAFETDWIAERQKAMNLLREAPPPPQITSSGGMLESIPLQLNSKKKTQEKKRKKKSIDKKEKKKKKRGKKRKKAGSSSSSTSESTTSSSSGNESSKDKIPIMPAPSIRVAMRNINKSEEPAIIPPDPPQIKFGKGKWETIQENTDDLKKKDDIIISQWNTPQPIITESEKKLLEQLKGKLKTKQPTEENNSGRDIKTKDKKIHISSSSSRGINKNKKRSLSRGKKSRSISRDKRSRSISGGRRSRSLSRNRRSRSISRNRYKYDRRSPYMRFNKRMNRSNSRNNRRRRSYSRSQSRSRSRSSLRHRVEKAVVRYGTEFRPRIPDIEVNKKSKKDEDRKKSPHNKKVSTGKKLPFIGRMPVLAKKQQETTSDSNEKKSLSMENQHDNIDNTKHLNIASFGQQLIQSEYDHPPYDQDLIDYDDLMPDPMQFVKLMGVPPPPPPMRSYDDEKEILPPGIDENEAEFAPKPINDAPLARKGPLPKDFEEALNIIFPDENAIEDKDKQAEINTEKDILIEDSQINLQEQADELAKNGIHLLVMNDTTSSNPIIEEELIQECDYSNSKLIIDPKTIQLPEEPSFNFDEIKTDSNFRVPSPTNSEKERRQQELDDLAMLGIDADDLAAQCI